MIQLRLARHALELLLIVSAVQALAQDNSAGHDPSQLPSATGATNHDSSNQALFGATTDLQNSLQTKGAELGLGKAPQSQKKRKGEFAFAPIPLLNPSIGNGMGAAVMYLVPLDANPATPPSTFAVGGFGTGNGSWAIGLGTRLYLKDDRYRITAGYGGGTFNYNYYGIGPAAGAKGLAIPF